MKEEIILGPWKPEEGCTTYHSFINGDCYPIAQSKDSWNNSTYNMFPIEEAAKRCALRELAMRKLYRFAEQLNPPRTEWNPNFNPKGWFVVSNVYGSGVFHVTTRNPGAGEVPFHSGEACKKAWKNLSKKELASLFW